MHIPEDHLVAGLHETAPRRRIRAEVECPIDAVRTRRAIDERIVARRHGTGRLAREVHRDGAAGGQGERRRRTVERAHDLAAVRIDCHGEIAVRRDGDGSLESPVDVRPLRTHRHLHGARARHGRIADVGVALGQAPDPLAHQIRLDALHIGVAQFRGIQQNLTDDFALGRTPFGVVEIANNRNIDLPRPPNGKYFRLSQEPFRIIHNIAV